MLIYSKKDLYNRLVQEQTSEAFLNGNLSKESYTNILSVHTSALYTPYYFIRIALGLLTLVATVFSALLLALIFQPSSSQALVLSFFFFGLFIYVVLELLINSKKYYNAGVDNLLMLFSGFYIVSAFVVNTYSNQNIVISAVAFAVCLLLSARFADGFMAVLSYIALFLFVFFLYIQSGSFAKATAPFVMMIVSAAMHVFTKKLSANKKLVHYRYCCEYVMLLTLITFYASANYFVVKELSNKMFNLPSAMNNAVPLGWLFWILTFVIPLAYVVYGILRRDILFIRTGLVLIAIAVFTFRYYYSVLPVETAMLAGGALLVLISYWLIKYLTMPKHGFSFDKKETADKERINLKALIIAQAAGTKTNTNKGVEFGGGSFGGGGAGGKY